MAHTIYFHTQRTLLLCDITGILPHCPQNKLEICAETFNFKIHALNENV